MENIKGIHIKQLGFSLQKMDDLLYHEGPLLSLFFEEGTALNFYFYKWADCNEQVNRWLVFRVTETDLYKFLCAKKTLRVILLQNPVIYLLDLNNDLKEEQILAAASTDLPQSYLPEIDSFFEEDIYTDFALKMKKRLENSQSFELWRIMKAYLTASEAKQIELLKLFGLSI